MLILVLGSSFLVTFLGWEGVGLCSYLLVSFWFERNAAAVAGKKAFVTNRVGDVGFLLAMFLIFASYGTLDYSAMDAGAGARSRSGTATAIALLLLRRRDRQERADPAAPLAPRRDGGPDPGLGAHPRRHDGHRRRLPAVPRAPVLRGERRRDDRRRVGRRASPRCSPGTVALVQPDIKRVLAYSTISQLGYMFLAVGIGAYSAAVFMVIRHAFYKGCLFLGAGSVIHGNARQPGHADHGPVPQVPAVHRVRVGRRVARDRRRPAVLRLLLQGRDHQPGVPATTTTALWIVGIVAAVFTGVYMTRLIFLTFYGNERFARRRRRRRPSDEPPTRRASRDAATPSDHADSDPSPTVSLRRRPSPAPHASTRRTSRRGSWSLPVARARRASPPSAGFINLPFTSLEFLDRVARAVFRGVPEVARPTSFVAGLDARDASRSLFALVGIVLAYTLYRRGLARRRRRPARREARAASRRVLGHAYYYDDGISRLVDGPGRAARAAGSTGSFDPKIIDGAVNGVGCAGRRAGARAPRKLQDGLVRRYALGIALGAVALLLYVVIWVGR